MTATKAARAPTITVHIPLTFVPRGGRKVIRIEGSSTPQPGCVSEPIAKALARAHRWRSRIEAGEYASITELAKAEKVNQSYACRILRLSLLAPNIVEDALNGRLSNDINLKDLAKPLPWRWSEQIQTLTARSRP
jgi:hypothetical protein